MNICLTPGVDGGLEDVLRYSGALTVQDIVLGRLGELGADVLAILWVLTSQTLGRLQGKVRALYGRYPVRTEKDEHWEKG